ncbi:hypothetical protein Moror_13107 [Moniliophthora roreri MCA 2997]|uniref:Uncharacterized protein n=2 Tax=Moniliophthora roreri TaxID=221103 RepID=V2X8A6_MONRO|nr:hypothetical protein Moror_13107 [Moniliophthora roreri MCA 2997]
MVHLPARHHKRQQVDPTQAPTGDIFSGTRTLSDGSPPTGSLILDSSANTGANGGVPTPAFSISTIIAPPTSTAPIRETSTPTVSPASSATSPNQIPLGTVIGACIGAFVGAVIVIWLGFWLYKRADPKKKQRGPQRDAQGRSGNTWNKLDDEPDRWEGMNRSRGVEMSEQKSTDEHSMEKLTMFKKSTPSIRTEYTLKTEELPTFDLGPHPFAQYHPNLAKEMASSSVDAPAPPQPAFLNLKRVESSAPSWDAGTAHDSFLSLNSNKRVSGSMSPSVDMAIPTPPISSSEPHRWESAEVLNFDGQSAEIVHSPTEPENLKSNNPFLHSTERRKSLSNPFFNAQSSSRSPSKKGKSRDITPSGSNNPFVDDNREVVSQHVKVESMDSVTSNDRAIQSLLAALDATIDPNERLRIASMQSASSAYTADEDVADRFPLPPGASQASQH